MRDHDPPGDELRAADEFVCTDLPDPAAHEAVLQRSFELNARINLPVRRERARKFAAMHDQALRRGDQTAALIFAAQAREADQAAERDQKLAFRSTLTMRRVPISASASRRAPRARGRRVRRGHRRAGATRAGPSDEPGPGEPSSSATTGAVVA